MITAWRICKAKYATTAFDGYGARLTGGRWNSPGTSLVYTSSVASQAFLEMLIHADATIISLSYVLIPIHFDDHLVSDLDPEALTNNWRVDQSVTRRIGDDWVAASNSVIMRVPSAILHIESNFIINPIHPSMRQIQIGVAQPLIIDERIKSIFGTR